MFERSQERRQVDQITVLIASHDAGFRNELGVCLAQQNDINVVGEAAEGSQLLCMAESFPPDLLVWDMPVSHPQEMEIFREVHAKSPGTKILILSEVCSGEIIISALRYGCLSKTHVQGLLKAIHVIHSGDVWLPRALLAEGLAGLLQDLAKLSEPFTELLENLTDREQEVVGWLSQGMTNKEIATRLDISAQTVKKHVGRIFKKLGVSRRVQLVRGTTGPIDASVSHTETGAT
ncbi:MAG: LuxR C-terminal-related transcriptional regulator [Gammaproteobacteria bacterium]